MSKNNYFPPTFKEGQFHCPHCDVYAKQYWAHINAQHIWGNSAINHLTHFNENLDRQWSISKCEHCEQKIIWLEDKIIYPKKIFVPLPNEDLDDDIKKDYMEAAQIFNDSPRASAALLRLALQKLCKQLGEKGDNINEDIKNLVKKGLNPKIQQSLDILRITGNNAVHPGEINVEEDTKKVLKPFELLNFIADKMITELKEIDNFYTDLPESDKAAIDKRDKDVE